MDPEVEVLYLQLKLVATETLRTVMNGARLAKLTGTWIEGGDLYTLAIEIAPFRDLQAVLREIVEAEKD